MAGEGFGETVDSTVCVDVIDDDGSAWAQSRPIDGGSMRAGRRPIKVTWLMITDAII
jgi:hypothetical protein